MEKKYLVNILSSFKYSFTERIDTSKNKIS